MRPSTKQWRQLHGMSREIYGQPLAIWEHHDQPETREEASELIRTLHGIEPEEETMEETRVCAECDVEKPIDEFRKFGRGRMKKCLGCDPFEKDDPTEVQSDTTPMPEDVQGTDGLGNAAGTVPFEASIEVVPPNGAHWCLSELRDPRFSTIEQTQEILEAATGETWGIETSVFVLRKIADLDLS